MPKERFGLASGTPAGYVRSEPARRSATEPGASAGPYLPCTRTTKAICGPRLKRVSGDGRLVLQSTTQFPDGPIEAQALIEDDNGALLMATGTSGPLAGSVTVRWKG